MVNNSTKKIDTPNFVQQPSLEKLKCTRCSNLLSVFPIHRNFQGGAVCGRCPIDPSQSLCRDELYEHAVRFQKFPCINRKMGCLELLLPSQVPAHEQRCFYRKFYCPVRVYENCVWEGALDDLINHFETNHPTFLLNDCRFEIDFVNNHKENCLMPYGDDLYVVTREGNSSEKTFAVHVKYLGGTNPDIDNYVYELTLESPNKAYKYSVHEKVGVELKLQGAAVEQMLHNPITIIANLTVKPGLRSGLNPDEQDIEEEDEFDKENLEELECPVCMYHLVPPIYQCEVGHSICKECKEQQKDCPTCHAEFKKTQNFTLERLILNMIYPCRHSGCRFKTKAKDIRKHEATCIYGPFTCPLHDFENCSAEFPVSQLFNHIKSVHYESLLELDTLSIPFDISVEEDIEEGYIMQYGCQLFKLCFMYNHAEKRFQWAVQYVGPSEDSAKYNFELEIVDCNEKIRRMYLKSKCTPLADKAEAFQNMDDYMYLHYDQIANFIKNQQLTFRILINQKQL